MWLYIKFSSTRGIYRHKRHLSDLSGWNARATEKKADKQNLLFDKMQNADGRINCIGSGEVYKSIR